MGTSYICMIFKSALVGILPIIVHEGGHFIMATLCGRQLHFKFSWGPHHIPRWIWQWPRGVTDNQLKAICQAGFVAELALIPFMPWIYQVVALIHFTAYPWYANGISDLEGMI